jgi:hypothetical protein
MGIFNAILGNASEVNLDDIKKNSNPSSSMARISRRPTK